MVSFSRTHYRISLSRFFVKGAYRQEGPTGRRGLLARGAYWPQGEALAPVASPLATPLLSTHLAHLVQLADSWLSLGSFLAHPWLILGSPSTHSWLTFGSLLAYMDITWLTLCPFLTHSWLT